MWRYQSYDEGRTESGKTSSGRNPAFNLYLYIFIHRCTVDPLISEHIGTGGCSDMQNVRICKIMNIIIIIMNIIIDNNVNAFIYCITYLLNRYMEIVGDSARIEVEVRITSEDLYVHSDSTRNEKKNLS